jgi:hypothetical protein
MYFNRESERGAYVYAKEFETIPNQQKRDKPADYDLAAHCHRSGGVSGHLRVGDVDDWIPFTASPNADKHRLDNVERG